MHTSDSGSTSIRVSRDLREEIRSLENDLGVSTAEAISQAVHSLRDELKWKKIGEYYDAHPGLDPEDEAWIEAGRADFSQRMADEEG